MSQVCVYYCILFVQNLEELLDSKAELSAKLCQIGDSIVYKLVQWTKRLPFYSELPVEVSPLTLQAVSSSSPEGIRFNVLAFCRCIHDS